MHALGALKMQIICIIIIIFLNKQILPQWENTVRQKFQIISKIIILFKLDIVHILYSHYEDGELGRQYAKFYAKIKKNLMVLNVIYLFFIFILG